MQTDPSTGRTTNKKLSAVDFYAYRIMITAGSSKRLPAFPSIHCWYVHQSWEWASSLYLIKPKTTLSLRLYSFMGCCGQWWKCCRQWTNGYTVLPATFTGNPSHMLKMLCQGSSRCYVICSNIWASQSLYYSGSQTVGCNSSKGEGRNFLALNYY